MSDAFGSDDFSLDFDGPLNHYAVRVTTEHDCWGQPEPEDKSEIRWVIYDPEEDDPPIGTFVFKQDALFAAEAWNAKVAAEEDRNEDS